MQFTPQFLQFIGIFLINETQALNFASKFLYKSNLHKVISFNDHVFDKKTFLFLGKNYIVDAAIMSIPEDPLHILK